MKKSKAKRVDPYNDPSRLGGSIQTYSGRIFYPLDPREAEITLSDVAHGLAHKARFTGHTKTFYCTAEHSVRVSKCVEMLGGTLMQQFVALHHDDSDAYIPDVPTPLKVLEEFKFFRNVEKKIEEACYRKFGCVVDDYSIVKKADIMLLLTEKRDLMPNQNKNWGKFKESPIPAPYRIKPWTPTKAKKEYLKRHLKLVRELTQVLNQK
jgi:hypothetical protein